MLKIGIDAMGGDFGPEVVLNGVKIFMNCHKDVQIVLYGVSDEILTVLNRIQLPRSVEVINTTNNISADYKPDRHLQKEKRNSSIVSMSQDLSDGKIDGMFGAGNTAAYIMAAMLIVKKDSRKIRLALASEFPNSEKPISLGLDMGGNLSADPGHNLDYALLAKSYLLERYGIDVPVSLISITTEKGKGYPQDEESYQLLSDADIKGLISFDGYIEPDGILKGARKIIVGDARSMNLSLKGIKGGASYVISKIPLLHYIQGMFNKSGGALLLGAKKPIGKANGNSSAKTISIALEELFHFMKLEANTNIISKITARYEDLLERSKQKEEA